MLPWPPQNQSNSNDLANSRFGLDSTGGVLAGEAAERQLIDVDQVGRVPNALLLKEEHRVVGRVTGPGQPAQPERHVLEGEGAVRPVEPVGGPGQVAAEPL